MNRDQVADLGFPDADLVQLPRADGVNGQAGSVAVFLSLNAILVAHQEALQAHRRVTRGYSATLVNPDATTAHIKGNIQQLVCGCGHVANLDVDLLVRVVDVLLRLVLYPADIDLIRPLRHAIG